MDPTGRLNQALLDSPVIASVKSEEGLQHALTSDCEVIFILFGNLCSISGLVEQIKQKGKLAFLHLDLIEGLSSRDVVVDFIREHTKADGIISTRPNLIRRAGELGFITIQRFFLLDSIAIENVLRQSSGADAVEILPATMPKVIHRLTGLIQLPLIAGGLIADKEDIVNALAAGAVAVSATSSKLWFL